jgi:hypothetical protein
MAPAQGQIITSDLPVGNQYRERLQKSTTST